jgi:hypothetical protein
MARPTNKKSLLDISQANFDTLLEVTKKYPEDFQFPEGYLNTNIRDVLMHLHHWHNMMIDWYEKGNRSEKFQIPAEGYTWKTLPDLNRSIQEQHCKVPFTEAIELVTKTHQQLMAIIENHSDEELFTKKKYYWTGTTSLGAYLIGATSSHYDWATKLIKKCAKSTNS